MRNFKSIAVLFCTALSMPSKAAPSHSDPLRCDAALLAGIPDRSASAAGGSEIAARLASLDDDGREAAILREISQGNIPDFQRRLAPVLLSGVASDGHQRQVMLCVMPDYLAVGSDKDFLFVPMRLKTALTIAARLGFMLPTRRIVDAIYSQAAIQLHPQPLPAGERMRSTDYYRQHTELVRRQLRSLGLEPGALTAGDKKDLVITDRLWAHPDRVAIYGWHTAAGRPIQPLSTVHGERYADYSHGVRLVASTVSIDGRALPLASLLSDAALAPLVSDEGAIPRLAALLARLSGLGTGFAGS